MATRQGKQTSKKGSKGKRQKARSEAVLPEPLTPDEMMEALASLWHDLARDFSDVLHRNAIEMTDWSGPVSELVGEWKSRADELRAQGDEDRAAAYDYCGQDLAKHYHEGYMAYVAHQKSVASEPRRQGLTLVK